MRLEVIYFAHAARAAGRSRDEVELPDGCSVGEAAATILRSHPALAELEGTLQFAVQEEIARPQRLLKPGDSLAVLPPFSGG